MRYLAALAALGIFVAVAVLPNRDAPGYDLVPLVTAGRLLDTGQAAEVYAHDAHEYNVSGSAAFDRAARDIGFTGAPTPFVYPPLIAVAMEPISRLRFPSVMEVWTYLSALFVLATLWLIVRLYAPALDRPLGWAGMLLLATLLQPVRYGFWLGQTTSIIFLLIIGALALQRRGREGAAGVALAIAAFVKLTPALLALPWLWRGPRRAFVWFAGASAAIWGLSLALAGWTLHAQYIARVREIGSSTLVAYNNHPLPAFLTRFDVAPDAVANWGIHPLSVKVALLTVALILSFVTAVALRLRRIPAHDDARWRPLAEAAAFLVLLLAPTIAWTHYFVALLPVLAVLAGRGAARRPGALVAMGTAVALVGYPLLARQDAMFATGSNVIPGPTLAALLLAVLLVAERWEDDRAVEPG